MTDLCEPSRCLLDRLDQRLCRERLCEIGEASGFQRSHPDGRIIVRGDVDNGHGNARRFETMPQVDAGFIVQVDVEDDAKRFFEIVVVLKGLGRREQDTFVTVFTQQSLYAPERAGVIIDDKDDISIWQERDIPSLVRRHSLGGPLSELNTNSYRSGLSKEDR